MKAVYEIMHGEKRVARIDMQGRCKVYEFQFMPFNLYLEETEENETDVEAEAAVRRPGGPPGTGDGLR